MLGLWIFIEDSKIKKEKDDEPKPEPGFKTCEVEPPNMCNVEPDREKI